MQRHFSSQDLPVDIYADDIGGVDNLGTNFRTIFIVYSRSEAGILKPVPVLCVVRPQSSILVKGGAISKMLARQRQAAANIAGDGAHLDS